MSGQVYLLDIEGTIGDISFVRQVLFPYAEARFETYLQAHWQEAPIQKLIAETGESLTDAKAAADLFEQWSRADLKRTPLKDLQGLIWRAGYESGQLRAHLYPDAIAALRLWAETSAGIWIYSSGSIAAQKLYFTYSDFGDVTPLLKGYFDTTSGPKTDAQSFTSIARQIGVSPARIKFLTDMPGEAHAASQAGCAIALIDRRQPTDWQGRIDGLPAFGSLRPLLSG